MSLLRNITRGLRSLFRKNQVDRELDEELRAYLEMEAAEKMRQGISRKDALREVRLERGSLEVTKELVRSGGWEFFVETCWQDLRFAARILRKSPVFTAVAVLTLTLGIGATTAIFGVVDAVLLRSLPYRDPQRLVSIFEDMSSLGFLHKPLSAGTYVDLKAEKELFEDVAAGADHEDDLIDSSGEAQALTAEQVTQNVFSVLGVTPLLGRDFLPGENTRGQEHVVLLSYRLWRNRFAGNAKVVGQEVRINGEKYTIVGVMPAWFSFPNTGIELWRPIVFTAENFARRNERAFNVVGRLRSDVTLAEVNTRLSVLEKQAARQYPADMKGESRFFVEPLEENYTRDLRRGLETLLASVAFILLIACANMANLLLSRAAGRQREIAVRTALGANKRRIVRQLLTESTLLALGGGVLGIFLALASFAFLKNLVPEHFSRTVSLTLNLPMLTFAAATAFASSFIFGLVPALRSSRVSLDEALKEGTRGNTCSRYKKLGDVFIVGEVALSLMLLVGAGLLIRSLWNLQRVELGFQPDHVLTNYFAMAQPKYQDFSQRTQFFEHVLERVRAIPGVETAALTGVVPLTWKGGTVEFTPDGTDISPEVPFNANERVVTAGYFETMRIPLIRGRPFDSHDTEGSPFVAIVNFAMAEKFWPNEDVIGKRFKLGYPSSTSPWIQIVGLVGNVKQMGLSVPSRQEIYLPYLQTQGNYMWPRALVTRTSRDPRRTLEEVRQAVKSVDPEEPLDNVRTMDEIVDQETSQSQTQTILLSGLAALALIMACVGIYGVTAYTVAQRKFEMGIRMALGAYRGNILRLVLGHGARLAAAGVGVGITAAFAVTRLMSTLLFEVSPFDSLTFISVALLLTFVALAACYVPARRAMRVDPMVALRYE